MKKTVLLVLLMSLCGGLLSAEEFRTRREIDRDARQRLNAVSGLTVLTQANYVRLEGVVGVYYSSPGFNFAAFGVTNTAIGLYDARVECDNRASELGCLSVAPGDPVVVYAHLQSYLSCRVDGPDVAVKLDLLYKRLPTGAWVLLSTP